MLFRSTETSGPLNSREIVRTAKSVEEAEERGIEAAKLINIKFPIAVKTRVFVLSSSGPGSLPLERNIYFDAYWNAFWSEVGIESTIIDCTSISPRILRLGAITEAMINEVAPLAIQPAKSEIKVSGSLPRHYSPKAKVLLNTAPIEGDGYIASVEFETPKGVVRLASPTSINEFAHDLYQALRKGDRLGLSRIVVRQPEGEGLAAAIRDRLIRSATE